MHAVRSLAAGLLIFVYLGVIGVPCPPQVAQQASPGERVSAIRLAGADLAASRTRSQDDHAGHDMHQGQSADTGAGHEAHHAASNEASDTSKASEPSEADCHTPPQLLPRCPCGCDEKSQARVPGGRLDPTMLVEMMLPPPQHPLAPSWAEPNRVASTDPFGTDKVPI